MRESDSVKRSSSCPDLTPLTPTERAALQASLHAIHERRYFEAHEILELAWAPCRTANRTFLQAIIHVAVGAYHAQNGNHLGMERQFRKAHRKLLPFVPEHEGIDVRHLIASVESILAASDLTTALAAACAIEIPGDSR